MELQGKVGGAFGAYGWSGEAPDEILDTMKNVFKMDMVDRPLKLKTTQVIDSGQVVREYGRELGRKMGQ